VKSQPLKLLFICSQNRIRSLTAEHMFQGIPGYAVKSAGTEPRSRIRVNQGHIGWADVEKKHKRILEENFTEVLVGKQLICLHVPDVYRYTEPALVDDLKACLGQHIEVPD
jgi:predicted protein tyrosine phosphatase